MCVYVRAHVCGRSEHPEVQHVGACFAPPMQYIHRALVLLLRSVHQLLRSLLLMLGSPFCKGSGLHSSGC